MCYWHHNKESGLPDGDTMGEKNPLDCGWLSSFLRNSGTVGITQIETKLKTNQNLVSIYHFLTLFFPHIDWFRLQLYLYI